MIKDYVFKELKKAWVSRYGQDEGITKASLLMLVDKIKMEARLSKAPLSFKNLEALCVLYLKSTVYDNNELRDRVLYLAYLVQRYARWLPLNVEGCKKVVEEGTDTIDYPEYCVHKPVTEPWEIPMNLYHRYTGQLELLLRFANILGLKEVAEDTCKLKDSLHKGPILQEQVDRLNELSNYIADKVRDLKAQGGAEV